MGEAQGMHARARVFSQPRRISKKTLETGLLGHLFPPSFVVYVGISDTSTRFHLTVCQSFPDDDSHQAGVERDFFVVVGSVLNIKVGAVCTDVVKKQRGDDE